MPTNRTRHDRETVAMFPAQFSFMTTAAADTTVRTIARNGPKSIAAVLREAVDIGIAAMVERGDHLSRSTRTKRARRTAVARGETAPEYNGDHDAAMDEHNPGAM